MFKKFSIALLLGLPCLSFALEGEVYKIKQECQQVIASLLEIIDYQTQRHCVNHLKSAKTRLNDVYFSLDLRDNDTALIYAMDAKNSLDDAVHNQCIPVDIVEKNAKITDKITEEIDSLF